jgi:hypothetical protein
MVVHQEFVHQNVNKSNVVSMIYGVCKNRGEGIGYSYGNTYGKASSCVCLKKTPTHLYSKFVPMKGKGKGLSVSDSVGVSELCKINSEGDSEVVIQNLNTSDSEPKDS